MPRISGGANYARDSSPLTLFYSSTTEAQSSPSPEWLGQLLRLNARQIASITTPNQIILTVCRWALASVFTVTSPKMCEIMDRFASHV